MRLLVCGSRFFTDKERIKLDIERAQPTVIIQGKAKGADSIARDIAIELEIPYLDFPADWKKYGKRAGFIRNKQMLDEGKPDAVLAYPIGESVGTRMMMDLANKAGVPILNEY